MNKKIPHLFCTNNYLSWLSMQTPNAVAELLGSEKYPALYGRAMFYQSRNGVFAVVQATGLPTQPESCSRDIFAMHIHAGGSCTGTEEDPFADAGTHYNPTDCPHPAHAGDLPPLFGNDGYAWSAVLTNRFTVSDIIGKTLIIHSRQDDFTSQPAGNAGAKIACGVITRF